MKIALLAVVFAFIAIKAALVAYDSCEKTSLASDGSSDPSGNPIAADPISSHASKRPRKRDRTSSKVGRAVQFSLPLPDSITSAHGQLDGRSQHASVIHADLRNLNGSQGALKMVCAQQATKEKVELVSTRLDAGKESGRYQLAQPAVWADPGDLIVVNPDRDRIIQQEAERLVEQIASADLPTDSNEYRVLWNEAVADSDELFRKRYGSWDWMVHHVQAHHLASAGYSDAP